MHSFFTEVEYKHNNKDMKNLYLHIILIVLALFTGASVAAQDAAICTPFDTTGCVLDLEVAGDVFAGYRLKGFPRENYPDTLRQRYFHLDPFGEPVRQIVVTKEKWWNCPDDLLVNADDVTFSANRYRRSYLSEGDGGYRLRAVTPKEYKELRDKNMIWGEWFDCIEEKSDIEGGHDLRVIVCYPDRFSTYHGFRYCLELMVYTDGTGQEYMTVARNPTNGADYTRCATDGRYDCRMIGVNIEEERHWMDKSKEVYPWIRSGLK